MRKHADTGFWISIIAPAFVFPVAAIAMFTVWCIRLDLPPPTIVIPSQTILAVTRPVPPALTQVEAAAAQLLEAVAEPAAPPPASQTPELLSITPVLGNAPLAYADSARDTSTAESPGMQATQQTAGAAKAAAPQPDAKETERVFVPPTIETLAVAPPMLRNTPPAYTDPARDASPPTTLVMLTEPAAPEPSTLIVLPRPRPRITVASGSRTAAPLPRPRPVQNSPPRTSQQ